MHFTHTVYVHTCTYIKAEFENATLLPCTILTASLHSPQRACKMVSNIVIVTAILTLSVHKFAQGCGSCTQNCNCPSGCPKCTINCNCMGSTGIIPPVGPIRPVTATTPGPIPPVITTTHAGPNPPVTATTPGPIPAVTTTTPGPIPPVTTTTPGPIPPVTTTTPGPIPPITTTTAPGPIPPVTTTTEEPVIGYK